MALPLLDLAPPVRHRPAAVRADALHAFAFRALGSLPPGVARSVLRRLFDLRYLRHDPWGYQRCEGEAARRAAITWACEDEPVEHLVEVGCGEGHLTEHLLDASFAARVTAIDVSARAVARARDRLRGREVTFVVADARNAPVAVADLVVCSDLLYYVGDDRQVAALVDRLITTVRPGGRLVLAHPERWATRLHGPAHHHRDLQPMASERFGAPDGAYAVDVWRRPRVA